MPLPLIPLLLGGVTILGGGYGLKKGYDGVQNFKKAGEITDKAKKIYDKAKGTLENMREDGQKALEKLGQLKRELYVNSLKRFVGTFEKIKNIDFTDPDLNVDPDLIFNQQELAEIREITLNMADILGGSGASIGGGALAGLGALGGVKLFAAASTGTAISTLSGAAATNATLAWFGGGSLAAGGLGVTGGMAVLGGVVAAPVLLVGGLLLSSKAESAVSDAYSNLHKAKAAADAMTSAYRAACAIARRTEEIREVLENLQRPFNDCLNDLDEIVGLHTDYRDYSVRERQVVGKSAAFAKTVKNVMEAPIFDNEGEVTQASQRMLQQTREFLVKVSQM